MAEWEYLKIDLNQRGPREDELDLLNRAGADGWELVGITATNIAYLKRPVENVAPAEEAYRRRERPAVEGGNGIRGAEDRTNSGHEVKVTYRDPKTNETWTGRGRMATSIVASASIFCSSVFLAIGEGEV